MPPLALLAGMYSARYSRRVELQREGLAGDALREALARSERQARRQLLLGWERLLSEPNVDAQEVVRVVRPHLQVWLDNGVGRLTYRVTQVLTGHGCFGEYLCRFGRESTTQCHECGAASDSVEHTVEECPRWASERRKLVANIREDLSLEGLLRALASRERDEWEAVVSFCSAVMEQKEAAEQKRERLPLLLGRPRRRARAGGWAHASLARPRGRGMPPM
ncbi:uncharacterized protein LOC109861174 [Pseudomyrmex gracilis]|uniref:uncharacterized protein LOC109861174 n=1 Tax=Pseudomyrmex gracilis TaxID=219809 RepID=UPI000994FD82|nr:uncharacterized protein LOC109861174 [Pseudomyrmex gracilis]